MKISSRILMLCAAIFLALAGTSWADETLTFGGNLTVSAGGKTTEISGTGSVSVSKIIKVSTQDDHPSVMAMIFTQEGITKQAAAVTVRASKSFTVSGKNVNGVFALKGKGDNAQLESVGGEKSPYTVPAKKGDYYIGIDTGIDYTHDDDDDEFIDAVTLQYVKIAVK